jgi:hypothetical protein
MEKIDRLGWAGGICFRSYGWRIGIRTNEPKILERVWPLLPPGCEPSEPPIVDKLFSLRIGAPSKSTKVRNYHLLYSGTARAARTLNLEEVLQSLESELQIFVAEFARERIFVHAGVVGWKGKALLLPGRSFAGKSTLVAALLRAGATYYSDEYAVLDEQGLVYPYLRRLSLREKEDTPPARRTAAELGAAQGTGPLPVGLVAFTKYQTGQRWQPRALSAGKAVVELLNNTVPSTTFPDRSMRALVQVPPRATSLKGLRGEAEETANLLLTQMPA